MGGCSGGGWIFGRRTTGRDQGNDNGKRSQGDEWRELEHEEPGKTQVEMMEGGAMEEELPPLSGSQPMVA